MDWLAPQTAAIAAAVAVPALVLMYFLKLRRQEVLISSTLLWKRAVRDLEVNAPFQRLRRNLLLLIQLLILAAMLAALGRPVLRLAGEAGRRHVLLLDRSASMNAADAPAGRTRLEEVRRQARTLIDSLRGPSLLGLADRGDEAMVIAFDRHARVMCNFTSNKARLRAAVEAVTPTDGPSYLHEAVTVAQAFAQSAGAEENNRSATEPARLELFSDGRIADLAGVSVPAGMLRFHCIGTSAENLAVVALQARRAYEKPQEVHVFASLANSGPAAVECDVELAVDGVVRAVRRVRVGPARAATDTEPARAGRLGVTFVMSHGGAGVISVRHTHRDPLPGDDAARTVLPPPRRLRALLVSRGNPALEPALEACPLARLDRMTPAQFDAAAGQTGEYDIIVLDRHAPADLPPGRYLVFGAPPPDIGVRLGGALKGRFVIDWRTRHPVLQAVAMDGLYVASAVRMLLPRDAAVLAEFGTAPAMALLRRRGGTFLLVAFDPMESNWPFQAGFVMFCYNAATFLGTEASSRRGGHLPVGEAITVRADGERQGRVIRPDGRIETVSADPGGVFRYPRTDRVGLYRLEVPGRPAEAFAVNILDEHESLVAPSRKVLLATGPVEALVGEPSRGNLELWPYLALAALVLVCVEWLVYRSRVRL